MSRRKRPYKGITAQSPTISLSVESSPTRSDSLAKGDGQKGGGARQSRPVPVMYHPRIVQLTRPTLPRRPSHGIIPTFVRWLQS